MATSGIQSIAGIGSDYGGTASTNSSADPAQALDMNAFLKMFLTQLQHQDPTSPMESYQLAAQLAQFSTVAKLSQATTTLDNVQQYTGAINNGEMTTLVGKNVKAQRSEIDVSSGAPGALSYTLATPSTVSYSIQDASGNTVYTGNLGSQNAGSYNVPWTGKDSSGNQVPDGAYTCTVAATGADGTVTPVQTMVQGQVYSCNLNEKPPTYLLSGPNGIRISVADVSEVSAN